MAQELLNKLGDTKYDNLIADIKPEPLTGGAVIRKLSAEGTLKRGTILAKSSADGKLVILGTTADEDETLTPYGILYKDTEVGTTADEDVVIYTAGCFDGGEIIVKEGYTLTESDIDALRAYGIIIKYAAAL